MINSSTIKKTGHKDIDTLFVKSHSLIRNGESLQNDIRKSLAYTPKPLRRKKAMHIVSSTGEVKVISKD